MPSLALRVREDSFRAGLERERRRRPPRRPGRAKTRSQALQTRCWRRWRCWRYWSCWNRGSRQALATRGNLRDLAVPARHAQRETLFQRVRFRTGHGLLFRVRTHRHVLASPRRARQSRPAGPHRHFPRRRRRFLRSPRGYRAVPCGEEAGGAAPRDSGAAARESGVNVRAERRIGGDPRGARSRTGRELFAERRDENRDLSGSRDRSRGVRGAEHGDRRDRQHRGEFWRAAKLRGGAAEREQVRAGSEQSGERGGVRAAHSQFQERLRLQSAGCRRENTRFGGRSVACAD